MPAGRNVCCTQSYKVQVMFKLDTSVVFNNEKKTLHPLIFLTIKKNKPEGGFSLGQLYGMASRQGYSLHSHSVIKACITLVNCRGVAKGADSGHIWCTTFPWCTHMWMSEPVAQEVACDRWAGQLNCPRSWTRKSHPQRESQGNVRWLCGKEYS